MRRLGVHRGAESTNSPHVTLSGQCAIPSMHKCTIALSKRREVGRRSQMWGTSKSKLGSHAKYGHLSNVVHKQELKRGGPLGEFPMRRQNPLLSFSSCSARSLLPTSLPPSLSSFEWHSNGASFPFKSGGNKKVRPNRFLPCRCRRRRCVRCTNSRLARSWKVGNPTPMTSVRLRRPPRQVS